MQPRRTNSFGRQVLHLSTLEYDRALGDVAALGVEQIGNRLQRRRLAGAVGAEQRDDAALWHVERHALEHQDDVIVDHLDIVDREDALVLRGGRRICSTADIGHHSTKGRPLPATGERLICQHCRLMTICRKPRYASASRYSSRRIRWLPPRASDATFSFMGWIQSEILTHLAPSHCCMYAGAWPL